MFYRASLTRAAPELDPMVCNPLKVRQQEAATQHTHHQGEGDREPSSEHVSHW